MKKYVLAIAFGLLSMMLGTSSSVSAQSTSPTGSYGTVDSWGNQICKRYDGSTATVTTRPS